MNASVKLPEHKLIAQASKFPSHILQEVLNRRKLASKLTSSTQDVSVWNTTTKPQK